MFLETCQQIMNDQTCEYGMILCTYIQCYQISTFINIYIYTYVYIHICIYTYMYVYIYITYLYICNIIYICTPPNIWKIFEYICIYIHTHNYIECTHVYAIAANNNRVFDRRNMGRVSLLLHLQYH